MSPLWFFLQLFKPWQQRLLLTLLLSTLSALAAIALLTLSGWFITAAAIAGSVAVDGVAVAFNFLQPAAIIRALAIIRTLGRYTERLFSHALTFTALTQIRLWFFAKLIPLSTGRLALLRSGDLLSHMTRDIDALDSLYLRIIIPITVATGGGCAVLTVIYFYSRPISLAVFWLLLIAVVVIPYLALRFSRKQVLQIVRDSGKFKSRQIELLQSLGELKSFKAHLRFSRRLRQISARLIDSQRKIRRLDALSSAMTLLVSQLALLAALLLAAFALQQQRLEGEEAALLIFCVIALFELAAPLPSALQMFTHASEAARRIRNITELSPAIIKPESPFPLPENCDLQLQNINFRYHPDRDYVLEKLSLEIPSNSKIAFVGDSGAGKTTLLHLLLRFFDPEAGHLTLGGCDYKELNSDELMNRFALLSQHSQLFAGTIKDNLLLAKKDAAEHEIQAALNAAGLMEFIQKLPHGVDTWIGEQGLKVSGGEARRIALARVYLKDAPIVLLDEPTEGLDAKTSAALLSRLKKITAGKTLIIVTHKEDVLALADRVYQF